MSQSLAIWLSVGIGGGIGILAILNLLASFIRNEQAVFKLRCEVERLQADFAQRMREMRELEAAGLKVIEVGSAPSPKPSGQKSDQKSGHKSGH